MSLRYRCLILDHDDTAVDSTAQIHYPAHVEIMKTIRPGVAPTDLQGWMLKNFHPGIMHYLTEELGMDGEDLKIEYEIWRRYATSLVPDFYAGFLEILQQFRARGGIITVVSHSEQDVILNHYNAACGDLDCVPDPIFGWDYDASKRKPSPYPVNRIMEQYALATREVLILDDLKPGVIMGRNTGVDVAGAGWGHDIPEIRTYMQEHCVAYFTSTSEFREFILS